MGGNSYFYREHAVIFSLVWRVGAEYVKRDLIDGLVIILIIN
jgi:hypothetical protein